MAKSLDEWLHEKNTINDALEKVETKIKVKRLYIFLGKCNPCVYNLHEHFIYYTSGSFMQIRRKIMNLIERSLYFKGE